jgi:predicted DNA-binding protein (MmcQ/YjbR family)
MVTIEAARKLALSFDEAIEQAHFEITSFRVNKKIFATMDEKNKRVCIKLSKVDQSVFSAYNSAVIYPVPNKWGLQGATYIELQKVPKEMFKDAMTVAYCMAAPKKLAGKYLKE